MTVKHATVVTAAILAGGVRPSATAAHWIPGVGHQREHP